MGSPPAPEPTNKIGCLLARIPRSFRRFLVTGSATVAVDAIVYSTLLKANIPADFAKGCSLAAATLFAYFANRCWAFNHAAPTTSRLGHFVALYMSAVCLNVLVNHLVL